jgi:hypothetical protein
LLGRTTKRFLLDLALIATGVLLAGLVFLLWIKMYPGGDDPKNLDYVLWKHGMNQNMNLDDALSAMTHDTWAVRLVQGKSKDELRSRFGQIRTFAEARPYD